MTEEVLKAKIAQIQALDEDAIQKCQKRWNEIAKPLNSLGRLETVIMKLAGIQKTDQVEIAKKGLVIMCADNGVVDSGVTQTGQEVTAIVSENFLIGKATASILCKYANVNILPIDIGIATDTKLENHKIAYGTKNMAFEPAMTREQAIQAVFVGIEQVKLRKKEGYQILATGEMGIGNTTTSSAIASVLLQTSVEDMTGRGAGLSTTGLARKIQVIKDAIQLHQPNIEDPIDVLSKVGGFDIAGLVGVFLGGAMYGIPIVIDGFISAVAALVAIRLAPISKEYMIASHVSKEPATTHILGALGLDNYLTCDMCLGEGTGAVMLFPILEMALDTYKRMSTFHENDITEYVTLT